MGKWNRRLWTPRNKYRDQYIPSPPTYYETEYKLRGAWKNSALPWEERFCISVGIPWQKVVVAKKCMYCHESVVKWNDCAGEETFCNAKKRFWAKINGLPCDVPLPDPDMYNDEIDWNPKIDPQLVMDLDRAYFNPDEAEKVDNVDITKKKVPKPNSGWDDKNPNTSDNPWECNNSRGNEALEDVAHGWVRWDSSTNENVHNPWEQGNTQDDRGIKDNTWGGCANNKSWDWNQPGGGPKNREWRDYKDNSLVWEQWASQGNVSNHLDYKQHSESGRKREGTWQYTSGHKSARFQADDYGTRHHWRKQRNQNSFALD